jgi:hypothetical protein
MQIEQLEMELRVEKRRRELRRRVPMGEAQWWFEQMRRATNIASGVMNENAPECEARLSSSELCAVTR